MVDECVVMNHGVTQTTKSTTETFCSSHLRVVVNVHASICFDEV